MAERPSPADHEEEEEPGRQDDEAVPPSCQSIEEQQHPGQSRSPSQQPDEEEGAECPGCQATGVLVLPCGHKLCPACIRLSQGELGQDGCTICYGSQLMDSVLQTLLDALFQGQPSRTSRVTSGAGERAVGEDDGDGGGAGNGGGEEELCLQHGELFSLFCLEDQEPVCQDCQREKHHDHQCCSIEEAVLDCKRELQSAISNLQDQSEALTSIRGTWQDTAAHIKSQSEHTSQVLREEFEKMHQYLRDEEAAVMSLLKQEEEEKNQSMKEKIDGISDDIRVLTNAIRETEEALELHDVLFLKSYKRASERTRCRIEEPAEESGALLDVAKHQGCLQYRIWDKMQKMIQYFPVTLDPNTAAVCLSVSTDLSSVFVCEEQPLPDNPERFVSLQSILGSEGFSSGRHSWEVEVGDNTHWSVGVARETIHRKDWSNSDLNPSTSSNTNLWMVCLSSGEYRASPGHVAALKLRRRPQRVRVQLDWERGCLTFSDASDNTLIYRFKEQWSSMLRPYLSTTCSKDPLRIMAGTLTVTAH
ncbi:E3 ubiquitin-protein ligase TRIM35 [Diretmus argenteus]